ncbi:adenosylcobinamide-GDP ribazoletransferase, partial [Microbispora rosea]
GAAIGATAVTAAVVVVLALVAAADPSLLNYCWPFDWPFDSATAFGYTSYSAPDLSPGIIYEGIPGAGLRPAWLLHRLSDDPYVITTAGLLLAMAAGLGAAALLRRRAVRRLGGVTGDVLGALVETATTVTLLVAALLL